MDTNDKKKKKWYKNKVINSVIALLSLGFMVFMFATNLQSCSDVKERYCSSPTPEPTPMVESSPTTEPEATPKILENMVMIRSITHNTISKDTHSINFTVAVDYNYDEDSKAVVTLHGRHAADSDSLTSFDIYSEQDIEKGYGSLTFEVDVYYFEKDELFFKAYIHPSPEEWLPIAESEPVNIHLQMVLESISIQLNENTDVDYEWVFLETITTTSAPSHTSDTLYEFVSMNYVLNSENTSMQWVYTYKVYKRVDIST